MPVCTIPPGEDTGIVNSPIVSKVFPEKRPTEVARSCSCHSTGLLHHCLTSPAHPKLPLKLLLPIKLVASQDCFDTLELTAAKALVAFQDLCLHNFLPQAKS